LKLLDLIEAAKGHRLVKRSLTAQRIGLFVVGRMQSMGVQTWGTKSFEFWTLLTAALWVVRPRSVLELGSGRSTSYLADYAMKEGVPFASIEQSQGFARRVRRGLEASFLDQRCVHHVPIGPSGWYDVGALDRLVTFTCECVFLDGPVGSQERLGDAVRDCDVARAWLAKVAPAPRLLIVDDVHREENLEMLQWLLSRANGLHTLFLPYQPGRDGTNVVAVAVEPVSFGPLGRACAAIGIDARSSQE
jgi:hypothetical protein